MFHIEGSKNYLADLGSRMPTGCAGNDRGDGLPGDGDSAKVIGAEGADIKMVEGCKWQPPTLPKDDIYSRPTYAQIFAYGANSPSDDPEVLGGDMSDSDDFAGQCLTETACYLSLSAGQRISVAMTADKIKSEIQKDSEYKYIRQVICGAIKIAKFEGDLSVYNYHRDNLTVTLSGIVMFKGSRLLLPRSLRPGLLKALHCGHAGVSGMIARA